MRELRTALGLTQQKLAELANMRRTDVVLIESNHNKASSHEKRTKLAMGLGLSIQDFDAYVSGRLGLDVALCASMRAAPAERSAKSA